MARRDDEVKVITLRVAENRDLTIEPTAAHVAAGQPVSFQAGRGIRDFLLVFEQGKPFDRVELRSDAKDRDVQLKAMGPAGTFHYQVIVVLNNGRIVADTGCPTVIIQNH
jgi:hypothetical protein